MDRFEDQMTDIVTLIKPDGIRSDDIRALITSNIIRTFDISRPFEENDIIERQLPNGNRESYTIIDPQYSGGHPPGIPASYKIRVKKTTAIKSTLQSTSVENHYYGVQSVQNGDNTVAHNTQNFGVDAKDLDSLIEKMQGCVTSLSENEQKEALHLIGKFQEQVKIQPMDSSDIKELAIPVGLYLAKKGVDLTLAFGVTALGNAIIHAIQNLH